MIFWQAYLLFFRFVGIYLFLFFHLLTKADVSLNSKGVEGYNKIYKNKNFSLYDKRILSLSEKNIMLGAAKDVIKPLKSNKFKDLDFGCGTGRHISLIEELAAEYLNINFNYSAYDPSESGLKELENYLVQSNFSYLTKGGFIDSKLNMKFTAYKVKELKRKNLKVTFLHPSLYSSIDEVKGLIGNNYHFIYSMYGAFAHIPGKKLRLSLLNLFKESIENNGLILLELPTNKGVHRGLLKKYNRLRKEKKFEEIGAAKEDGDILFKYGSDKIKQYYHIFSFA